MNIAFGAPMIAVDTHIFRVSNRIPLAPGKTPLEVERGLEKIIPARLQTACASLADPAWPVCLQGAPARMRTLPDRRSLPMAGQAGLIYLGRIARR